MASPSTPNATTATPGRRRTSVSAVAQTLVSATERVLDSSLPPGFLAATAEAGAKVPTVDEIRSGVLVEPDNLTRSRSRSDTRRPSRLVRGSTFTEPIQEHEQQHQTDASVEPFSALAEEPTRANTTEKPALLEKSETISDTTRDQITPVSHRDRAYTSGYIPPPKLPWTTSTATAMKGYIKWVFTPFGFLITIYGLNVVAWGGMLFLLLCQAAPAMCYVPDPNNPGRRISDCGNIDSPRRKWIEIDSQILNALFCVTGFGLAPWRFRDLWYLMKYRFTNEKKHGLEKKMYGLRKLGGFYQGWFRLPGQTTLDEMTTEQYLQSVHAHSPSQNTEGAATGVDVNLDPRIPIPATKAPAPPLTGVRAPDTKLWKVDFFIWMQVLNTFFQACLCGFMWGYNRIDRPSWSTGLFVALACGVAGVGGLVSYLEGKGVKRVEGFVPNALAEQAASETDVEMQGVESSKSSK